MRMADILNPHVIYDRLSYPIPYIIKSVISSKIESNLDRCADQMLASICVHKRSGFVYGKHQVCVCISRPQHAMYSVWHGLGITRICMHRNEGKYISHAIKILRMETIRKTGIIFMSATNVSTLIENTSHFRIQNERTEYLLECLYSSFHICSYQSRFMLAS